MVPVCLFRSGGPRPVFLSVFVLRGLQSAHPPSPMELLRLGTSLSGGGVMSVLCRVCHVFPPLVSIFGLFPVLVRCHYEFILVSRVCLIVYDYPLYIVLSFEFDFVWSTCYFPVYLVCKPALSAMSYLDVFIKYDYLSLYPRLRVLFLPCVCTVTHGRSSMSGLNPYYFRTHTFYWLWTNFFL